MERAMNALNRTSSNNTLINVLLFGCFGALAFRSLRQQREIEALEAEKDSLVKANKTIKNTIWNSKQQLFADAGAGAASTSNSSKTTPPVPLSKLKAIFGEFITSPGKSEKGNGKSPAANIMI